MNTRVKGNKARREVMEIMKKNGYIVDVVEKTGRFVKIKDMFNMFDLVSVKHDDVAFIQVASNRPHSHYLYHIFKKQYPIVTVIQYVKYDRKGFTKFIYSIYNDRPYRKVLENEV
jgi:ribosomal protein S8